MEKYTADDRADLPFKCPCVFQKYIPNPVLIKARKVDLRTYVLVVQERHRHLGSIYAYNEGLVRFASKPFSMKQESLSDPYVHVTNNAVNKRNSAHHGATENKLCSEMFRDNSVWKGIIFPQLRRIAFATFTSSLLDHKNVKRGLKEQYGLYSSNKNLLSFELFGIDVLLDEDMSLHLLEVNHMPELETSRSAHADSKMNSKLVTDMFNIINFHVSGRKPELQLEKGNSLFTLCSNDSEHQRF